MKNKCDDCKFANWVGLEYYENAQCNQLYKAVVLDTGNYVVCCSAYETKNIFKKFIKFLRRI